MRRTFVLLFVALACAVVAIFLFSRLAVADPVPVDTIAVARGDLVATLELTGTVVNDRTVTITALLDGEIVEIGAREGDAVEPGAALARLDNRFAATELDKAGAELELARQRLASATRENERAQRLGSGAELAGRALDDAADELARASLELRVAEAAVRLVELKVENATIVAPFAGTVTDRGAEVGQWVEAGTKLFTLVATDGDVIEARVDAADTSRVALERAVTLSSDGWPDRTWDSAVSWISPDVTGGDDGGAANRFAVRAPLGDGAPPLKLGERVDVSLETERRADVLTLPLDALDETAPGRYRVLVVDAGTARPRDVETGLVTIDAAEIVGGLEAGERVVTPAGAVEPGTAIRARDPAA